MLRTLFKSKIHRATVTETNLGYGGSITIDRALMEAADILPHERVQVVSVTTGARFETYAIAGERGTGIVCLNGAAARLVQPGDVVILITYAHFTPEELSTFRPRVVLVDEKNRITDVRHEEYPHQVL